MNAEVKQQWLEALRSGQYEQGREQLHKRTPDGDKFCCLGVLCDLAVKSGASKVLKLDPSTVYDAKSNEQKPVDNTFDVWYGDPNAASLEVTTSFEVLPLDVKEWAGVDYTDPVVWNHNSDEATCLSALNDSGGSFEEIADIIEEQL